jgi:hypothetical protein
MLLVDAVTLTQCLRFHPFDFDSAGALVPPDIGTHRTYLCAFFRCSAQRAFIACEIRFRAATDIGRRLLPGGLPQRLSLTLAPSRCGVSRGCWHRDRIG